jgi:hypothetical protein
MSPRMPEDDALFPGGRFTAERSAARAAVASGDVAGVIAAGQPMADERAVFGTLDEVAGQLCRYGIVDWALLYPPHLGVDQEHVHANDLALVAVAASWISLLALPHRHPTVRGQPSPSRPRPA